MTGGNWRRQDFSSRGQLAEALAATVAGRLRSAIKDRNAATLAVSGGSTPALFFAALSAQDVEWDKVVVTLADERFVAEDSPRSNAGLVKSKLLQGKAARARFVPLAAPLDDIAQAAAQADAGLRLFGLPLDVAVLGMGIDGHTASFFPDAANLDNLLDPDGTALVSTVDAPSAGEPRLTLTLPIIASARFIALHIEGAEKQSALDKSLAAGSTPPIRRVLDAAQTPVEIFWAA